MRDETKIPLLCRLGFHDYETVDAKTASRISQEIDAERTQCARPNPDPDPFIERYYKNKVCLRCGKQVDEIEKKRQELIAYKDNRKARQNKAVSLLRAI